MINHNLFLRVFLYPFLNLCKFWADIRCEHPKLSQSTLKGPTNEPDSTTSHFVVWLIHAMFPFKSTYIVNTSALNQTE